MNTNKLALATTLAALVAASGCSDDQNSARTGQASGQQDGQMAGQQDGQMVGQQDGQMAGQQDGQMAGQQDGQMVGQQDGQMGGQQNTQMAGQRDPQVVKQQQADQRDVRQDLQEASRVLQEMQSEQQLQAVLEQAQGIFVVPDYATASLLIGGAGGEGVLLTRQDGQWTNPAMYDIGSISAGLQAGGAAGSIGMILMSEAALNEFTQDNNFSLNAEAGYSVIDESELVQASAGKGGDVVVWSNTEGLLAEAALSVTDIHYDEEENQQYYGREVTAEAILSGQVASPKDGIFSRSAQR